MVGDRHRLITIGVAAVFAGSLVFAVSRLVLTVRTGRPTPWWANAVVCFTIAGIYLWYRRRPDTRSSVAAHGTAAVTTVGILIPVAYGMASTIWWLGLVGFAMVLLGRPSEARVWGIATPLLVIAATLVAPLIQVPGALGEWPLERALSRIVFVVTLVAMAAGFRRVANQRAAALHESERTARALIDAPNDVAVLLDARGTVIAVNRQVAESIGTTPEELVGTDLFARFEPEVGAPRRAYLDEVVRSGKAVRFEDERHGRVWESAFYPIVDPHGKVTRVAVVARDVTAARRAELALRDSEKMHAIGRLAGGVAHDFNNLLQVALGTIEVLRARSPDPGVLAAGLAELEADVRRGAALTRQLLLYSRHDVERAERLDLNDVVRGAGGMIRRLLREHVTLRTDLAGERLPVIGDAKQLEQVLVNLVVNASDAMPAGGALTIRTARHAERALLEVSDTGSGMTDELKERIFEPFFTTKKPSQGTGLGLAVVKGVVESGGGSVEVESRVGKGSTFRVLLPISAEGAGAETGPAPIALATGAHGEGAGARVLVVEDEPGARASLVQILEMLHYRVTAAADAEEALDLAAVQPFDIVLSDFLLPGLNGAELAGRLQAAFPRLKVVLMSGYTEDPALRLAASHGEVRFLQKPFDVATLTRELAAAIAG